MPLMKQGLFYALKKNDPVYLDRTVLICLASRWKIILATLPVYRVMLYPEDLSPR